MKITLQCCCIINHIHCHHDWINLMLKQFLLIFAQVTDSAQLSEVNCSTFRSDYHLPNQKFAISRKHCELPSPILFHFFSPVDKLVVAFPPLRLSLSPTLSASFKWVFVLHEGFGGGFGGGEREGEILGEERTGRAVTNSRLIAPHFSCLFNIFRFTLNFGLKSSFSSPFSASFLTFRLTRRVEMRWDRAHNFTSHARGCCLACLLTAGYALSVLIVLTFFCDYRFGGPTSLGLSE